MGYFNSSTTGTVTGGAEDVSVIKETFLLGSLYRVYQKSTSTTRRIAGVSLATAQSLCVGSASLSNYRITAGSGNATAWDTVFACCGTKQSATYSQIGDSNLYEVSITNTTLAVSENGSSWSTSGNIS